MSVNQQQVKKPLKSRSAGPGGKKTGMSSHCKNPVFLTVAASPKDPPPGSSDWVAANTSSSSASGKVGGATARPSGWGLVETSQDPTDFPVLVPPVGSSTSNLPHHEDAVIDQKEVEQGKETLADNF